MNLMKQLSVAALVVGLACSPAMLSAGIIDLDFTSDGSGAAGAFGGGAPYGTAPGFTPFVVAELGPGGPVSVNPSVSIDGVTFTINGSVSAWPGNNGAVNPDILRGDYLFFGNADGTLGVTPRPMPWTVTGLDANEEYVFTFVHGNNAGAARWLEINSGAAPPLTIDGALGSHIGNMTLTADGSGTITGTFTGGGGEGNLAALSINPFLTEGDVNGDGLVNGEDFDIISEFLFTQQSPGDNGDLDLNGTVDFADFRIWKNAPKSGLGSLVQGSNSAVPEPGSLVLVVCGMFFVSALRNRAAK